MGGDFYKRRVDFLALALLVLKGAVSPLSPFQPGSLPSFAEAGAVQSPTPSSGLPNSGLTPTAQPQDNGAGPQGSTKDTPTPVLVQDTTQPLDPNASQQAQDDLKKLSQALDGQSAAQQAADSLKQGNYDEAAKELQQLGQDSDQLSDSAKKDLF